MNFTKQNIYRKTDVNTSIKRMKKLLVLHFQTKTACFTLSGTQAPKI